VPEDNFIGVMRFLKSAYEDFLVKYNEWMGIDSIGLAGKVDKIDGKGLSENDYTTLDKNKLAGIESSANNYVHPAVHPVAIIDGKLYPMQFVKTDANGNTGWGYVNWSEIVGKPADQDNVEFTTHKGVANGYCPLGADGKIDPGFINSLNAFDTFFPADIASMLMLNAGLGDFAFVPVGVDGNGDTVYDTYQLGALPASTQANWKKINIIGVSSVNGKQGVVVLSTDDINEGIGNLYFTNERVDDRVAAILNGGTNITITYDDATGAITISANDISVEWSEIQNKPTTLAGYGITDTYTKTETDTNIATAIASLVDASPTTLDTLNELAAALGDDPNFATTITNLIALKAPIDSPTFTGYIGLPKWTTATRPVLGVDDRVTGFNVDINSEETWNGSAWVASVDIAGQIHAAISEEPGDTDEFGFYDSLTGLLRRVSLAALAAKVNPAGTVIYVASSVAPYRHLKANGAAVSRSIYAALDTAIYVGDTNNATALFGYRCTDPNNPSSTRSTVGSYIVLPDLRSEFLRGWDDGRGIDSGRSIGTLQLDQFQGHHHNLDMAVWQAAGGILYPGIGGYTGNTLNNSYINTAVTTPSSDNSSGEVRKGAETRPRNIALLACIKY